MRGSRPLTALCLFAVVSHAACVSGKAGPVVDPFREGGEPAEDILLTVYNNDLRDATVYVYWNVMRARAGSVSGGRQDTFRMRWRSETVHLEVDFLAGGGYRTELIDVAAGDHLNFVIMPGN